MADIAMAAKNMPIHALYPPQTSINGHAERADPRPIRDGRPGGRRDQCWCSRRPLTTLRPVR